MIRRSIRRKVISMSFMWLCLILWGRRLAGKAPQSIYSGSVLSEVRVVSVTVIVLVAVIVTESVRCVIY